MPDIVEVQGKFLMYKKIYTGVYYYWKYMNVIIRFLLLIITPIPNTARSLAV